jgi:MFS family permease
VLVVRVCAVLALLNIADGMVSTLASAYVGSLGYPLGQLGLIVALYSVASLASRFPSARLADSKAANRWLIGACLAFTVSLALYPLAHEPIALWSVRILHGLTFGAATTLNMATFLAVCTSQNRRFATALFTASWSGGYSVGNFAAGFLADGYGFGVAFLIAAVCPLLAIAAHPHVQPAPMPTAPKVQRAPWKVLLRADVRAVPLLAFCVYFLNSLLATLFPLYVLAIGETLALAGTARALQSLANTVVRPISAPFMQRVGSFELGAAGVALTAIAVVALPFSTAPLVLLGLFVVVGIGRAVGIVANATGTLDLSERGVLKRGTASALMTGGGDAGSVIAPLLAGATAAAIDLGPAMQVLAIGIGVIGVAAVLAGGHSSTNPSSPAAHETARAAAVRSPGVLGSWRKR